MQAGSSVLGLSQQGREWGCDGEKAGKLGEPDGWDQRAPAPSGDLVPAAGVWIATPAISKQEHCHRLKVSNEPPYFLGCCKRSGIREQRRLPNLVNTLKTTESHPSKRQVLWYANHITVKRAEKAPYSISLPGSGNAGDTEMRRRRYARPYSTRNGNKQKTPSEKRGPGVSPVEPGSTFSRRINVSDASILAARRILSRPWGSREMERRGLRLRGRAARRTREQTSPAGGTTRRGQREALLLHFQGESWEATSHLVTGTQA